MDLDKILHFFKMHNWKLDHDDGANSYYECSCGKRDVTHNGGGYSPINRVWLYRDPKLALDYNNPPSDSGTSKKFIAP